MRTAQWVAMVALAAVTVLSGCLGPFSIIVASGTFSDRSRFSPSGTGFAVLDETAERTGDDGQRVIEERAEPRVVVVLTGTVFDPETDLAGLPHREQADLVRDLRDSDLLIIQDLPASLARPDQELSSSRPSSDTDQFTFFVQRGTVSALRNASASDTPPLGTRQTVTLLPSVVDLRALGRIDLQPITVDVQRGAGQGGAVNPATGSVTVRASVPILQERLGESNARFIKQVLRDL